MELNEDRLLSQPQPQNVKTRRAHEEKAGVALRVARESIEIVNHKF